jgi:hypothetical protein
MSTAVTPAGTVQLHAVTEVNLRVVTPPEVISVGVQAGSEAVVTDSALAGGAITAFAGNAKPIKMTATPLVRHRLLAINSFNEKRLFPSSKSVVE